MSSRIGVIAEDETDFEVLRTVIQRHLGDAVGVSRKVANGCAKITAKAEAWLRELAARGCTDAVIVHDLDRNPQNNALNDETALSAKLNAIPCPGSVRRLVCIPVEEIEAWFWSDEQIITRLTAGRAHAHSTPDRIIRPKEELIRLSMRHSRERYSTNLNPKLAAALQFEVCAARCPSFARLLQFLDGVRV